MLPPKGCTCRIRNESGVFVALECPGGVLWEVNFEQKAYDSPDTVHSLRTVSTHLAANAGSRKNVCVEYIA